MALADELKTLQELHEKGKLTDQEYADAKAATLAKQEPPSSSRKLGRFIGLRVFPLLGVVIVIVLVAVTWYSMQPKNTTHPPASGVQVPITLTDEVQNVPANSWKGQRYMLPVGGELEINLQVVSGNPINVSLVPYDQLETMQKGDWSSVKVYSDFGAVKTKTYRRTGRVGPGDYFLVLRDTSLGLLSSPASDISLKVKLNP